MTRRSELEAINGKKALAWVEAQNKLTHEAIHRSPAFQPIKQICFDILKSKKSVDHPTKGPNKTYWQVKTSEKNPRGLLCVVDPDSYRTKNPKWKTILDIDALATAENRDWKFKDLEEQTFDGEVYCMIGLSEGGADVCEYREFDWVAKTFKDDGFYIPPSRATIDWVSKDEILLAVNFTRDSLTSAGYPRYVGLLKRGERLQHAQRLFSVDKTHMQANFKTYESDSKYLFYVDEVSFYHNEYYLVDQKDHSVYHKLPIPSDVEFEDVFKNKGLVLLRSDWHVGREIFKANSLVSFNLNEFKKDPTLKPKSLGVKLVYSPPSSGCIRSVSSTDLSIFLEVLDDVNVEIIELTPKRAHFEAKRLNFPQDGDVSVLGSDVKSDVMFMGHEDFLTPHKLYTYHSCSQRKMLLKETPRTFNPARFVVNQFKAISKDGTQVPYFVVSQKNLVLDGSNPALLCGYGGFGDCNTPGYLQHEGPLLLEKGIVYVQANIRGGGEFGTQWAKDGMRENKPNSFDDFIAVAEDLIARNITSPACLGIRGSSNGGLLVGACFVKRPDLFSAVVCEVPLLDMLNYHRYLAGPSWLDEYGDPDDPKMREILASYSPLHNLKKGVQYPPIYLQSSTADDRVTPYHARAMAEALHKLGQRVYYFETQSGAHTAGVDLDSIALDSARIYTFLYQHVLSPALARRSTRKIINQLEVKAGRSRKRGRDEDAVEAEMRMGHR